MLKMRDAIARFTLETFKRGLGSTYYVAVGDADTFNYYESFDKLQNSDTFSQVAVPLTLDRARRSG